MNLNKKAEIFLGMNTTDFFIFAALSAASGMLAFVIYLLTKAGLVSLIIFAFLTANCFLAVSWYKRQPARFFQTLIDYMNSPDIYLPGRKTNVK